MRCLRGVALGIFIIGLWALPVWAGEVLVGLYLDDSPADAMRVVYKDENHFRIDMLADDRTTGFILVTENRRWLAERDFARKIWEVFDFDLILAVFGPEGGILTDEPGAMTIASTGEQTVNGLAGQAFTVTPAGAARAFKLVLTADADIAAVTRAWASVVKDLGETETVMFLTAMETIAAESQEHYGLLRYNDKLVLKSIRRVEYPDNYFELPRDIEVIGPQGLLD